MTTPLEIQNHEFSTNMRGYNREEVKHFLYAVSEEMEHLLKNNQEISQELEFLKQKVREADDRDKILKDTLISAQQIKREIKENAHKEAELIIREGQLQAENIFENAKSHLDELRVQISDMKRMRGDLLAELEMMLTRCNHFIEAERSMAMESDKLLAITPRKKKKSEAKTPVLKKKHSRVG
ncbi:MAG: hypothetical protein CR997_00445 [Acidobacteria bacterium]|nr:MAG: hypothetical protein CR997_00445 [Acidobacteriota bacterium]